MTHVTCIISHLLLGTYLGTSCWPSFQESLFHSWFLPVAWQPYPLEICGTIFIALCVCVCAYRTWFVCVCVCVKYGTRNKCWWVLDISFSLEHYDAELMTQFRTHSFFRTHGLGRTLQDTWFRTPLRKKHSRTPHPFSSSRICNFFWEVFALELLKCRYCFPYSVGVYVRWRCLLSACLRLFVNNRNLKHITSLAPNPQFPYFRMHSHSLSQCVCVFVCVCLQMKWVNVCTYTSCAFYNTSTMLFVCSVCILSKTVSFIAFPIVPIYSPVFTSEYTLCMTSGALVSDTIMPCVCICTHHQWWSNPVRVWWQHIFCWWLCLCVSIKMIVAAVYVVWPAIIRHCAVCVCVCVCVCVHG